MGKGAQQIRLFVIIIITVQHSGNNHAYLSQCFWCASSPKA